MSEWVPYKKSKKKSEWVPAKVGSKDAPWVPANIPKKDTGWVPAKVGSKDAPWLPAKIGKKDDPWVSAKLAGKEPKYYDGQLDENQVPQSPVGNLSPEAERALYTAAIAQAACEPHVLLSQPYENVPLEEGDCLVVLNVPSIDPSGAPVAVTFEKEMAVRYLAEALASDSKAANPYSSSI